MKADTNEGKESSAHISLGSAAGVRDQCMERSDLVENVHSASAIGKNEGAIGQSTVNDSRLGHWCMIETTITSSSESVLRRVA